MASSTAHATLPEDRLTAIIRALRSRPLQGYPRIRDLPEEACMEAGRAAVSQGRFRLKGMEFDLQATWRKYAPVDDSRSRRMYLHSWNYLEPLFLLAEEGSEDALVLLRREVEKWLSRHARKVAFSEASESRADAGEEDFVLHIMALAGRFYRIAWLLDALARVDALSAEDLQFEATLLEAWRWHGLHLAREDLFSGLHNHHLQAAAAQVAGTVRFLDLEGAAASWLCKEEWYAQGARRLIATLLRHVAADGMHKEHSPHYHLVVLHAMDEMLRSAMVRDAACEELCARMRNAASWLFDIEGRPANFGDTDRDFPPRGAVHYKPPEWPADVQERSFPQGGYWFVRGTTEHGRCYLAQLAAFHSRVHKHADTGTFIWQDRGRDILIDAGRYGYAGRTQVGSALHREGFWYAAPERLYVESTRAHNTLELNGQSHRRTRVEPPGSCLLATATAPGIYAAESCIPHLPQSTHWRLLVFRPGEWLICIDTIRHNGDGVQARQWFQVHPRWQLLQADESALHFRDENGGEHLHARRLFADGGFEEPANGLREETDGETRLQGWWSPAHLALEPCTSVALAAEGQYLTLGTLFTFSPVEIDDAYTCFNVTRRALRMGWRTEAGEQVRLQVLRNPAGAFRNRQDEDEALVVKMIRG